MNFFRKLERKFGRFAIPNLMYYIIMMYAAGFVMSLFNPYFYVQYLALDAAAILRGQVWRIVTFLVCPPQSGVLFALLAMYLYYSIGSTLERVWGPSDLICFSLWACWDTSSRHFWCTV
ncbi:hypothetical protein [Clostridium sp. AM48-13]|uniref:hypothetical protein n=1 Tax=Clostridium sp. AM48-13 TaxID=2293034 RepID=UPI0026957980